VWSVSYTHGLLKTHGLSVGPFHGKNGDSLAAGVEAQQCNTHEMMGF
jgi:hypothetical protein